MKRYLITTADERSWVFDQPVLFLGEWCRRYDRKHIWSRMDAVVAEPYILRKSEQEKEILYLEAVKSRLLDEMISALNSLHQTDHDKRYWEIVIGHWLQVYVPVMYNRYKTLEKAIKHYDISSALVMDVKQDLCIATDSTQFIWSCDQDLWNHVCYSELLQWMSEIRLDRMVLKPGAAENSFKNDHNNRFSLTKKRQIMDRLSSVFMQKNDAFIINSYLPAKSAIKLNLSLYQFPQIWNSYNFDRATANVLQRKALSLNAEGLSGVEQYIFLKVLHHIPTCYLEGYKKLVQKTKQVNWPSEPKFIFTSNNFHSDEVFKVWLASKVEQGVPYFAGQHGNNYETRFDSKFCPEVSTSDKFLTWGWEQNIGKDVPAFIFKIAGKKRRFDPLGGLLLIELHHPHLSSPFDECHEFSFYQEEQFLFANSLPKNIHQKLIVRLHHDYKKFPWMEEKRWKDSSPDTVLETGNLPIDQLISRSRLIVHSYDSTGILETLALNIPTLCFWNNEFKHVLLSAQPSYELLKAAGIYQSSAEDAVRFIADNWDNLDEWWFSKQTQEARENFCSRFARTTKKPIRLLKQLLIAPVA
tara:strand:- start:88327 stop:90075 length:1749 start_codon:yes stop_codon:yes gene_type:complete